MSDDVFDLARVPIHLGRGATATACEPFDGSMEWYSRYADATATDGHEGRLVSWHSFSSPWDMWEMHPNGHEVVVCVTGPMTLHQEIDGSRRTVTLDAGQAVVNEPGVWHTADVDGTATAMFITAGVGTEHRPR
jgi:mannose-6-phosphate isomerase-like protein (cupin superfamily)